MRRSWDRIIGSTLALGYLIGGSLIVAVLVFGLCYAQQVAIWSWTFSLGPDLYVSTGMALFAFVLTAAANYPRGLGIP